MTIIQFRPHSLNQVPDKPNLDPKPAASNKNKAGQSDFASALKAASSRPANEPGNTIFKENLKAMQLPSLDDLGQADRLLKRVGHDIKTATPEALRNVHDLEGLIYLYRKNNS